jgi:polysaccharide export outer membrane protein
VIDMKHIGTAILMVLAGVTACSRAQSFAEKNPEYTLQRGDVLDIHYRYTPEFDQVVTIRPDNQATLLHFGSITTAGMTVSSFQKRLVELSSKTLVDPDVTVILKEYEKPHVYVEGEVNTPGKVEFRSDISVLDAIALAGGFKTSGKKSKVLLMHRTGNGDETKTAVLDLKKLIDDRKIEEAVVVRSNDVIYVTQDRLSKVERIAHLGQFGAVYNPLF